MDVETGRPVATLDDPNQDRPHGVVFTPDGTQLVYTTWDSSSVHVWDLRRIRAQLKAINLDWDAPPYTDPGASAPDLLKMRVVNADPLDHSKMAERQRGQAIFKLYLNPFDADAHLRLGTLLVEAGQMGPGSAHLMAGLAFRPDLSAARSQAAGPGGHPHERGSVRPPEALERGCRRLPRAGQVGAHKNPNAPCKPPPRVLLTSEDRAGYRRICKQMLDQFHNTTNPYEAEQTAKTCLISGVELKDDGQAAKLAEIAVQRGQAADALAFFQFTRGLSEYRQGRYRAAMEWFAHSRKAFGRLSPRDVVRLDALIGIFEAMALHQLDRTEEAAALLARKAAVVQKVTDQALPNDTWHDWLFCQVALSEAKAVLNAKPEPSHK